MERFTFQSAHGKSIVIDYDGPITLIKAEGLGRCETIPRVTTGQKQVGNTLQETKLGARIMNILFMIEADSLTEAYTLRAEVGSVFNTLVGEGILTYENNAVKRSIKCSVTASPDFEERNGTLNEYSVELTAQNPLFFDPIETVRMVQDFVGGLRFPIRFDPVIRFARRGDAISTVITGDAPSPIRVEFRGGCTNPRITCETTGEFIQIGDADRNVTLETGDKLIVSTEYGNKTADLIRADGSVIPVDDYVSDASTFFALPLGRSKITFKADAGTPTALIAHRNWFVTGG